MVSLFLLVRRKRTHVFSTHFLHTVCAELVGEKQKHSWTKLKGMFNLTGVEVLPKKFLRHLLQVAHDSYTKNVSKTCVLERLTNRFV